MADSFEQYYKQNKKDFAFKWLLKLQVQRANENGETRKNVYLLPWEMLNSEDFSSMIDLKLKRYVYLRLKDYEIATSQRPHEY